MASTASATSCGSCATSSRTRCGSPGAPPRHRSAPTWSRRHPDARGPGLGACGAMSGYDLHTHSTHSDGTNTIAENVRLALERDLEGIAVTDHDTTAGLDEAAAAADGTG